MDRDDRGTPDFDGTDERTSRAGLNRRTLVQAAILGVAAPGAVAVAQGTGPGTGKGQGNGNGQGSGQGTPVATPELPQPGVIAAAAVESWDEPWVWRPSSWPSQQLELNVVENEDPGVIVGFGNPNAVLFSYNGGTPGPTIRMRGDETLYLRLRNMLGPNLGTSYVGPYPDPPALPSWLTIDEVNAKAGKLGKARFDFCLGEHANVIHANHDTNFHSHGLHVAPGRNSDGTHSDNVILRVIDQADLDMREAEAEHPMCAWLRNPDQTTYLADDETTGFADYEIRLGNVQHKQRERLGLPAQPHPPGTHWYHPHCHGSTHNQVSSGMAGFLIVEGDTDEAVNEALTGQKWPDPQQKTGDYDYIERVMLLQRVFQSSTDSDAHTQELKNGGTASLAVNGDQNPTVITMRPGAVERWRILNGGVDGQGYSRFMVVKGQYDVDEVANPAGSPMDTLVKLRENGEFTAASRAEVSADKQQVYQFAADGVNLIDIDGETPTYTIRDLAVQNAGTESPLDRELTGNPNQAMLANLEACFADAEGITNSFVRPNEVYLAPGNRADLFFQAPRLAEGSKAEIYTVLSREVVLHSDQFQFQLQNSYTKDALPGGIQDLIVAWVVVAEGMDAHGNAVPAIPDDFDVMGMIDILPEIQQYSLPIEDAEVQVKEASGDDGADPDAALPDRVGKYRTRTIMYSGWGAGDIPLVTTAGDSTTAANFRAFIERDQADGGNLESLRYSKIPDSEDYVLLAPDARTMAIAGSASSDVIDDMDPLFPVTANMARKFSPDDHHRPQMLQATAEEWAVYNYTISLWSDSAQKPVGQASGFAPGQPLLRADGQARFAAQPADAKTWMMTTKGVDHPFHIHQNPCWVIRVEVPDENGNLVNILPWPRWQDVVWLPRNGGRVIFRSRYPDYVGLFVNHCHILLHEDHGMMQVLDITPFAEQATYVPKDQIASRDASAEDVTALYPRLDQGQAWVQSLTFVDPNHDTGQKYPGFVVAPPTE